jgi:hypothetical protein
MPYLGRFWRVSSRTTDRLVASIKARDLAVEKDHLITESRKNLKPSPSGIAR